MLRQVKTATARKAIFTNKPAKNSKTLATKPSRCSATRTSLSATNSPKKPRSRRYEKLIYHLGNAINEAGCPSLEQALYEVIGSDWKDRYKAAAEHYAALA